MTSNNQGFAGKIAKQFIQSKLTSVFVLFSLLLGVSSVILTPKEEEPQISVPMIDIQIGVPGLSASDIEKTVTEPIEKGVWGLEGVDYVYSTSQPNGTLITVRFKVGQPLEPSLVKVHHKVLEISAELKTEITKPLIKSYSIDDVPFLTLTFSSDTVNDFIIRKQVATLANELSSLADISRIDIIGGQKRTIRVIANKAKLQQRGITLVQLAQTLKANFAQIPGGKTWGADTLYDIEFGGRPKTIAEIKNIAIAQRGGSIVRITDVCEVIDGPEEKKSASLLYDKTNKTNPQNAVSLSVAKRKGTNIVTLTEKILHKTNLFTQEHFDSDIKLSVTRNYGETARDKSNELIEHLLIATISVAILIALFMGIRSALVVIIAVPVTLALTLATYYFFGYTLNRVTLFALIFSIGILVDDAIVVVENIERHLGMRQNNSPLDAIIQAVSEVGNPTILATFTVIAAILPMAFVRGLMGPYMKPIPVGASLAMIFSLFVAFMVTPWASAIILKNQDQNKHSKQSKLDQLYHKIMDWLLLKRKNTFTFGAMTLVLFIVASSLVYFKIVKVKMLPFDNKNEFQVLIDYPSSSSLEKNIKLSRQLAESLLLTKEVEKIQIYAGVSAPYSFSGMVKHVFTREREDQTDLQIVLADKSKRERSSHEIIEGLRPLINNFSKENKALTKVLEIPPGPPVLSTMLAEIYGPSDNARENLAKKVIEVLEKEPSVVDLDSTLRSGRHRKYYGFDYNQAGFSGVSASLFAQTGNLLFSETQMGLLDSQNYPEEIGISLSVSESDRLSSDPLSQFFLPSFESGYTAMSPLSLSPQILPTTYRHRKNLKPVTYVMSELSGAEEAPVYAMLKLTPQIDVPQQTASAPLDTSIPSIKWDGEWFITYEVFRDLGTAFAVVMVLIYILVLGWFKNYWTPVIIMSPIPISLIGILPGHALTGVYFTATSMIGFIAGAGIIVRNSIILVDFIQHLLASQPELPLKEAVIKAGVIRFRPMLLTASAVVVGSSIMLADPIFQGLAVSLIFGEIAATAISRFVVPVLYYWSFLKQKKEET